MPASNAARFSLGENDISRPQAAGHAAGDDPGPAVGRVADAETDGERAADGDEAPGMLRREALGLEKPKPAMRVAE